MQKRQAKKTANISQRNGRDFPFGVLFVVTIVILGIVFVIVGISPAVRPIRDALWCRIVQKLLLSAAVLYSTCLSAHAPPLLAKIVWIVSLILYIWAPLLLRSDRILLLMNAGILFILLFCALYLYLRRKEQHEVLNMCAILVGAFNLLDMHRYTFVNKSGSLHFWLTSSPIL